MLGNGLYDVPPGKLAAVVTHLEMRAPAQLRPVPTPESTELRRVEDAEVEWYRDLFTRVGGHDWLWFSRLRMQNDELSAILSDPGVEVYALFQGGRAEALLELDFRVPRECELAFFGVTARLLGTGAGRFLMNTAIEHAWRRPIQRFHVHTCTLDHPGALSFYRRSGFTPTRQQVEIEDDPRLSGEMPDTAGPHAPILRPSRENKP